MFIHYCIKNHGIKQYGFHYVSEVKYITFSPISDVKNLILTLCFSLDEFFRGKLLCSLLMSPPPPPASASPEFCYILLSVKLLFILQYRLKKHWKHYTWLWWKMNQRMQTCSVRQLSYYQDWYFVNPKFYFTLI